MSSRWAEDEAAKALRKKEKEEKRLAKLEKQRQIEEAESRRRQEEEAAAQAQNDIEDRPAKRRKVEEDTEEVPIEVSKKFYRLPAPEWSPVRNVDTVFERLNHIEEGSYGWVSRAKVKATGEIVALKKLKKDNLHEGFPTNSLREIQCLEASRHPHIVTLLEIVIAPATDDVYLVMEFLEHDLKTLQDDMAEPFLPSEIKTLMLQLTDAVAYLHENWIIHRDLKTSNILMNNRGQIKLADFGMARYFGSPPPEGMTTYVVTLWYRAPELLLGTETYNEEIDIWSLGCVFGELCLNETILQGKTEVDQLAKIFALCGVPTEKTWPRFRSLPNASSLRLPRESRGSKVANMFPVLTGTGCELLEDLLSLDPDARPTAADVLRHPWFKEDPRPKSAAMFPTFPSKAGQEKRRRRRTPSAPRGGNAPKLENVDLSGILK